MKRRGDGYTMVHQSIENVGQILFRYLTYFEYIHFAAVEASFISTASLNNNNNNNSNNNQ